MKHWLSLSTAALAAVVIGFASTILVLMQAAQAIGASLAQQASMAAVLCFAMAITSFVLCLRYKMPIIIAWSTPGAALIVGSAHGVTYPAALGAFVFAGALMVLTGLVRPLERAIERMPAAIAAGHEIILAGGELQTHIWHPVRDAAEETRVECNACCIVECLHFHPRRL